MYYTLKTLINAAEVELNYMKLNNETIDAKSIHITNDFSVISQIRGSELEPQARRVIKLMKGLIHATK